MQLNGLIKAIALGVVLAAPAAQASFEPQGELSLSRHGQHCGSSQSANAGLTCGDYAFGNIHRPNESFFDEWSFSLAKTADVEVSLIDVLFPSEDSDFLLPNQNGIKHSNSHSAFNNVFKSLLDNKFLSVSLFDDEGNLMGTAGENGTLTAFNLTGGKWYTLGVSGKAAGLMGSLYQGNLHVENCVSEVPLGDTLPLFSSALFVLALRARKSRNLLKA